MFFAFIVFFCLLNRYVVLYAVIYSFYNNAQDNKLYKQRVKKYNQKSVKDIEFYLKPL